MNVIVPQDQISEEKQDEVQDQKTTVRNLLTEGLLPTTEEEDEDAAEEVAKQIKEIVGDTLDPNLEPESRNVLTKKLSDIGDGAVGGIMSAGSGLLSAGKKFGGLFKIGGGENSEVEQGRSNDDASEFTSVGGTRKKRSVFGDMISGGGDMLSSLGKGVGKGVTSIGKGALSLGQGVKGLTDVSKLTNALKFGDDKKQAIEPTDLEKFKEYGAQIEALRKEF